MLPQWIIEKKRDGQALSVDEIRSFFEGYGSGAIPDYQAAAMAMAIYFRGMTFDEIAALTDVMMKSGDLLDTSRLKQPTVDKHSTGGIGDKVSLILAPLVACRGVAVPMISGRGLGITGGTLDKIESIPGYRTDLQPDEFLRVIEACGCSIIGQTARLAPVDKKLYALRDVTATVPSIPLITASIMSKKLAENTQALVLDVKWGSGAFMKTLDEARNLARTMVEVGDRMGRRMAAVLTDMNQPLGRTVGNAVEVEESIRALRGEGAQDLMEVTLVLGALMLVLTGRAESEAAARRELEGALRSGEALARFRRMVELHGGDPRVVDDPRRLPAAATALPVPAPAAGVIEAADADGIGRACAILGAGRARVEDRVDHAVGLRDLRKVGERVGKGDPLAVVLARNEADARRAAERIVASVRIGDGQGIVDRPLIVERVLGKG